MYEYDRYLELSSENLSSKESFKAMQFCRTKIKSCRIEVSEVASNSCRLLVGRTRNASWKPFVARFSASSFPKGQEFEICVLHDLTRSQWTRNKDLNEKVINVVN